MKTDNLKISIAEFRAWRAAKSYRASVKTRAGMLACYGKDQTNRNGKIYVHEADDFAPVVWDSARDARNTTGYYADEFGDSIISWCVVKIAPANRKAGRDALYAPVTYCTEWEGGTIHLDSAGSMDDAQRWGEQIAEREAEESREYQAEENASMQIDEALTNIEKIRARMHALIVELRTVSLPPAVCETVREKIHMSMCAVRENVRTIRSLRREFDI